MHLVLAGDSALMLECLVLELPHISGETVKALGSELFLCFHKTYSGIENTGELCYSGNNGIGISYIFNSM